MDFLFKDITIVPMDSEKERIIKKGYLGVSNGKISCIGEGNPPDSDQFNDINCEIINGKDKVIMPGLVNAHTHLPMTLLRGYADDMPLHEWLFNKIFPAEAKLTAEDIEAGAVLGAAELIAGGVTCCADMYCKITKIAEALLQSGIKGNISNGATAFSPENYDFDSDNVTMEMLKTLSEYHGAGDGQIILDVSVHAEYTSFAQVWIKSLEFAQKHGLGMHVHLSETKKEHRQCIEKYGKTPAEILNSYGVFDVRTIAAHCVWITPEDMDILKGKGVTAVHNPVSNLKLASGIAPVSAMLEKGINVAIGTDGASSNNNLDMFEEIKTAAIIAKTGMSDASALPAYQALKMATVNGAKALGRQNECGKLCVGLDADIIMIDFNKPHLLPVHNVVSSLCYSARGGDVELTMCKGKVLYRNGQFKTIDIEKAKDTVKRKLF